MFALCNLNMTGLHAPRGTPKFGPKVTHPWWFKRRSHSIANCGRMVTDSASFFLMVPSLTPYDLPFP